LRAALNWCVKRSQFVAFQLRNSELFNKSWQARTASSADTAPLVSISRTSPNQCAARREHSQRCDALHRRRKHRERCDQSTSGDSSP
jgi:hypothetical protein